MANLTLDAVLECAGSIVDQLKVKELKTLGTQFDDPVKLCEELVRRKWITVYQRQKLLAGQGRDLAIGQYVLLEVLGEGGMGEVFKARHRRLDRIDALKLIRKDQLKHPEAVQRFVREARAAARLSHPNIVVVYDADEAEGTHFFAMEFVQGIDLAKLVKHEGPLPVGAACDYARQAALGLQHAHERGLVHRDIKPANLLLTQTGSERVIKVLDMGLARVVEAEEEGLTRYGAMMGTPDFVAPEQARNAASADIRSDVYSLGCTLYFLLAAQPPFPGDSATEKVFKHWSEEPEPIESLRPDVPAELAAVLRKMMAKVPEDRFQTPEEVAKALVPFCGLTTAPTLGATVLSVNANDALQPTVMDGSTEDPSTQTSPQPTLKYRRLIPRGDSVIGRRRRRLRRWVGVWLGLLVVIGTAGYLTAPRWLHRLYPAARPPFDRLEAEAIPAANRIEGMPPEVVAVLGDQRWRHRASVDQIVFSNDGKVLVSASADRVAVRSVDKGKWLGALTEKAKCTAVAIHPRGDTLAAGYADGSIVLWELAKERKRTFHAHKKEVLALVFVNVNNMLLSIDGFGDPVEWNLSAETNEKKTSVGLIEAAAFAGDGSMMATLHQSASGQGKTLRAWATSDFKKTHEVPMPKSIQRLAAAPNGQAVLLAGIDIRLLQISRNPRPTPINLDGQCHAAFASNGEIVATNGHRVARFNGQGALQKEVINDKELTISSVAMSADNTIAFGTRQGVVNLRDLQGKPAAAFDAHTDAVAALAIAPDARTLASGGGRGDRTVRIWDMSSLKERAQCSGYTSGIRHVAYSSDSKTLAARDSEAGKLWAVNDGLELRVLPKDSGPILVFAPDGRSVFTANNDNTISRIAIDGGAVLAKWTSPQPILVLGLSPDGETLAIAHPDQSITLWGVNKGEAVGTLRCHGGTLTALRFSSDSKYLAVRGEGLSAEVWSVGGKEKLFAISNVAEVTWAGQVLLAAGHDSVQAWEVPAGRSSPLPDAPALILGLAVSPNKQSVAAVSLDGKLAVWNLADKKATYAATFPLPLHSAAFAPDSRHLAVGLGNGSIAILRLKPRS